MDSGAEVCYRVILFNIHYRRQRWIVFWNALFVGFLHGSLQLLGKRNIGCVARTCGKDLCFQRFFLQVPDHRMMSSNLWRAGSLL